MRLTCDVCGQFISFADIEDKKARRILLPPDAEGPVEEHITLCRKCTQRLGFQSSEESVCLRF